MRARRHRGVALVAALGAAIAVMAIGAPVGAAAPKQVEIVSHVTFNPDGPNYGDFSASGAATDAGVICETGTFVDTRLGLGGFQSGRGTVQVLVVKDFTCDDGSGTFTVKLQIQANFDTGIETFTWVVLGGTHDYASLRGGGSGSTVPTDTGNINTYEGFLIP